MLGIYLIGDRVSKPKVKGIRFKKNRYKEVTDYVKNRLENKEVENVFHNTGIKMTIMQYQAIRYLIVIMGLVTMTISTYQHNYFSNKQFITIIGFFITTAPTMTFLEKKTPFNLGIGYIKKSYEAKKDIEIYRAIIQLKNLAIAQKDKPLGADFIIQKIMKFTNITKPVFSQMLSKYRIGKEEEACEYFYKAIGTKLSFEFANIMLKLDKINPSELVEQLTTYQENIKEEMRTAKLRRSESISNLIFLPILTLALVILLNFVVVVLFIDQMESLMLLM